MGINGRSALGALIDAGADAHAIARHLRSLPGDVRLRSRVCVVNGFRATRVDVTSGDAPACRTMRDVVDVLEEADAPWRARSAASNVYRRLASAEARVHGTTPDGVTFHEVGSAASVASVLGLTVALELLGVESVVCSPVAAGTGVVDTHHGRLPVPAPATLELLVNIPITETGVEAELVTPTGAAFVAQVASAFGPIPTMTVAAVGYGADERNGHAPITRAIVGTTETSALRHFG
jgi:pyridinium-3,5-bisthiocarboxylic acid mononucleotide nickel chelatase